MEIEGLINHTLAAALVERNYIAKTMADNLDHIEFWKTLKAVYAHDELNKRLESITHIREILGSEEYMNYLIKKNPEEPLLFMGFPIKVIEFYIHLKTELSTHNASD